MSLSRKRVHVAMAVLIVFILFEVDCIRAQTTTRAPAPKSDTQSWNDVQLTLPLGKKIDFILLGTLRVGRDLSRPVDERIGWNFAFKFNKYFTLTPGYLHINMQPSERVQSHEERLSLAGTITIPRKRFTVSDRNLLERRFRSPQLDATRYRNRLQLEYPFSLRKTKLTLVVSDELFYDWSLDDWVRNRFLAGVRRTFTKHLTVDFYYLRQNDGRSRPGDLNVIGTIFRVRP